MDTYYKAYIVPHDLSTMVCWREDEQGNATDVLCESIDIDIDVIDLTYEHRDK